jgi:hypothetical protein
MDRDATEYVACAVRDMALAQTEIAWALSRGETGQPFYSRIDSALDSVRRAQEFLTLAAARQKLEK